MALKYGIDEEAYNELPQAIQESIKKSWEESQAAATLKDQVTTLTAEVTKLKEGKPPVQQPSKDNPFPDVTQEQMLNYQNRRDIIMMNLSNDANKHTAFTVKKFREEVKKYLDSSHPKLWADEKYIRNIVNMVAGEHQAEIISALQKNDAEYTSLFTEGSAGGGEGSGHKETDPSKLLSAEEKKMADQIGMSYQQYYDNLTEVRRG